MSPIEAGMVFLVMIVGTAAFVLGMSIANTRWKRRRKHEIQVTQESKTTWILFIPENGSTRRVRVVQAKKV